MGYFKRLQESLDEQLRDELIRQGHIPAPAEHPEFEESELSEMTAEDKEFFGIDEGDYSCILDHDDYEVYDCD